MGAADTGLAWLITGVSSGLGRALAQAALARGDRVAGTVRAEEAVAAFEALAPGRALGLVMDLTDEAAVGRAAARAEAWSGGVDVLVNNAGYGLVGAVEEVSLAEARAQFEVNVLGPLAVLQAVLPGMRARGRGRVLNVTSVSGLAAWSGTGVYCASKFALEALGETLAQEVAGFGIKVTNVAPGGLRTDYAGRSLVSAARRIEAYDAGARESERLLTAHAGSEPGDPHKTALAILACVDAADPPLHLLLGADAIHYATRKIGALVTEIGDWAALSVSTAADGQGG